MIKTIVLIILCHLMGDYVLQCDFIGLIVIQDSIPAILDKCKS